MRDIASVVGFESPALYYYYKSKHDLLYEIVKNVSQDVTYRASVEAESADDITEKVRSFLTVVVTQVVKRKEEAGLIYEARSLHQRERNELRQLNMALVDKFIDLLEIGVREKVFSPCDTRFTAILVLNSAFGISRWYRQDGRFTADEIAKMFADWSMRSLLRQT